MLRLEAYATHRCDLISVPSVLSSLASCKARQRPAASTAAHPSLYEFLQTENAPRRLICAYHDAMFFFPLRSYVLATPFHLL